ncbi:uncharacterized protein LOC141600869 [Silene latifolia]|uniref:uncharacterized protein LOC141600869 n=1 Tax=Silene latifolia TaxID=37657 RepID=UPI003D782D6F
MVLNFFPRNAKALFRKAVALKKLNRFSEAHTTLEEASLTEPHNKDIIQELEDVRQSLAINKNGKRVIVDSWNANDVRAGKVLVFPPQSQKVGSPLHRKEEDMVEIMDEASCASSQLGSGSEKKDKKHLVCPVLASDYVPITSPAPVPKDSKSSRVPNETVKDSEFKFAALRGSSLSKEECRDSSLSKKGRIVDCRSKCRKETVLATSKTRSLTSAGFSASFCRSTRNASTTMRMKRKDVHLIEFDAHYHPPFKIGRLFSSVASTCSVSSVTWFSGSFGVANTSLFVL